MKTLEALYGRPLCRLRDSVTSEESSAILGLLDPLIDASQEIIDKLSAVLAKWDADSCVGDIFDCMWARYYDYIERAESVKTLLKKKLASDEELRELLKLHRGAAKHSVSQLLMLPDNAPCHKANVVMNYLNDQGVEVMNWPAKSPDMNPIENLWKTLEQNVMTRNSANVEDLWLKSQEEWAKITVPQCQDLLKSCARGYAAVIENKDRSIKY
ncbi:Dbl (DH) domain [Trinorchestia longiramus]|nr:Dbl (DH) domain [Trinorchestia longiramus]